MTEEWTCPECGEKVDSDEMVSHRAEEHHLKPSDQFENLPEELTESENAVVETVEREEKLPTSAYEFRTLDVDGSWAWATNKLNPEMGDRQFEDVHELVRRDKVDELLPVLAHRLWWYWSRHIAEEEDISDSRVKRWEELWKPFEELSEEMQEKDSELVQRFFEDDLIDEVEEK